MARQLIRKREAPPPPGGGLYFASEKANLRFIHTGCTVLDCVLGGGWPLGRFSNIVGDKSTGKTLLAMEAIANFCQQYPNGAVYYNEAESAFDADYARALGIPFDRVDYIEDCDTVERLINHVSGLVNTAKKEKTPRPVLYIIDSLDALSDKAEKERDVEKGDYGAAKAKMVGKFFRLLSGDIKRTNTCLLVISQVRDNIGVTFGEQHTRSGGRSMDFYASQVLWLAHLGILKHTVEKIERATGVRIKANCKKNKVSLPYRTCDFEITFGYGIEDVKASKAFLTASGTRFPDDIDQETLRQKVIARWYEIERTFLPEEGKYAPRLGTD